MYGMLHTASKVKDKQARQWVDDLRPYLAPGEELIMLSKAAHAKPLADALAVTTARVIVFASSGSGLTAGPRIELLLDDIQAAEMKSRLGVKTLHLINTSGEDVTFGTVPSADADDVLAHIRQAMSNEMGAEGREHIRTERKQTADAWAQVCLVGKQPSGKTQKLIEQHCAPGEAPWFLLHSRGSGVLAAFSDRCMIIKSGAMTGQMAGSFGGARITTFPYRDITAIEYNSGMLSGVLEILTPSYQGTANKDFWRGTLSPRNANSNDPFTMSNTLPLPKPDYAAALPYINQMREMITKISEPAVRPPVADTPGDLTEALAALSALHDSGALTDEEFAAAKRQAINPPR